MTLRERATQAKHGLKIWAEWLGNDKHPVEVELAQARANVCLACPLNQPGNIAVEAVALAIRQQLALKKHLQLRVQGEKILRTCSACSCPLRLKIWEQLSRVLPEPSEWDKYWESCWLKTEKP